MYTLCSYIFFSLRNKELGWVCVALLKSLPKVHHWVLGFLATWVLWDIQEQLRFCSLFRLLWLLKQGHHSCFKITFMRHIFHTIEFIPKMIPHATLHPPSPPVTTTLFFFCSLGQCSSQISTSLAQVEPVGLGCSFTYLHVSWSYTVDVSLFSTSVVLHCLSILNADSSQLVMVRLNDFVALRRCEICTHSVESILLILNVDLFPASDMFVVRFSLMVLGTDCSS